MRDCLLVLCYDYGKGVPSCGFMTNEQFYNGGPTMNFFNAYASTEGYKSVVYPETLSGKGSDDICSLLMLIILASHSGQGWLLLCCDGEIKNINWVVTHFL